MLTLLQWNISMKKSWAHVRDWKCPAMCYQMVFIIPTPHWRVTMLPLHQSCPPTTRKPDLSKSYRMKVSIFLLFFVQGEDYLSFRTVVWSFWLCISSLFFSSMIGEWRMPPYTGTSGLNPQVCLILFAFWRPFSDVWLFEIWIVKTEKELQDSFLKWFMYDLS